MANDLNTVAVVGRLTRPCDMRYTNSGYQICSFSIAVNKNKKQQDGTWKQQAHFFECTLFGKLGESVSQYLQKGQQVAIQGSLEQQTWETNGQKHSKIVIIVDNLSLIGGKSEGNTNHYNNNTRINEPVKQYHKDVARPIEQQAKTYSDEEIDDIPF